MRRPRGTVKLPLALIAALVALVVAACGGDEPSDVTCEPSGTTLRITATNLEFDKDCLAAPAGQPFEIVFENADSGQQHNVAIYPDGGDPIFRGEIFGGGETVTYEVPAIPAGTYRFQCDVHPQMMGPFIVE
jgi:plastocyanin